VDYTSFVLSVASAYMIGHWLSVQLSGITVLCVSCAHHVKLSDITDVPCFIIIVNVAL